MLKIFLKVSSPIVVLMSCICFSCFIVVYFFLNIDFMQLHNTFLKFLVIPQVIVQGIIDIIFELSLVFFLVVDLILNFLLFLLQTIQLVLQILYDQLQVSVDDFEMFDFILHFRLLLVQDLDFLFSWSNLVFEFFDFIVKYEFEFFKFLSSFAQLINFLLFISNGCLTLLQFTHLTLNLDLASISISHLIVEKFL